MDERIQTISTDRILDPKDPMRTDLNRDALFTLAENIKQNGLINPITVRPAGDMFEVVAGHRRLAASRIAGLVKIDCVVRALDDSKTFEVMAAENLERADVDPVDEAIFIARYMAQSGKNAAEVAKSLRRSLTYVESRIAVGQMPDYMREHIKSGNLKLGVALLLCQITDEAIRRVWVEMAVRDGVSVAQAEYWLHGWRVNQLPGAVADPNPPAGYEPDAPRTIMFRCAIDGKEYDAATFKTVMIHNANMPLFLAFVRELNAPQIEASISPSADAPPPPPPVP